MKTHEKTYELKKREIEKQKAQLDKKKLRDSNKVANQKVANENMRMFAGLFNGKETKVKACEPMPMAANKYSQLTNK